MAKNKEKNLEQEILKLRQQLAEAEDILNAIKLGEVDAFVMQNLEGHDNIHTLKGSDFPYRTLVETMNEGALTLGHDGTILYANNQFSSLVQESIDNIIGDSIYKYFKDKDKLILEGIVEQNHPHGVQVKLNLVTAEKTLKQVLFSLRSLTQEDSRWLSLIVTDLTDINAIENKIQYLATHDQLTKLPNQISLMHSIADDLDSSMRLNQIAALLYLDIDDFNDINVAFGREVGDTILRMVAERLVGKFTQREILIGRIGGEEFIVFISEIKDPLVITLITQNILKMFERPYIFGDYNIQVSITIGIALYPENGGNVEELIKAANYAMQWSKRAKRAKRKVSGSFKYCTEKLIQIQNKRRLLENELKRALLYNEFCLYYQPKVDLKDGSLIGLEALIRWERTDKTVVSPNKFIPIAEKTGLINPLGEWVLEEACRNYWKWFADGITIPKIAVNLSVVQLRQVDILDRIENIFRAAKISAKNFELELTENMLIGNLPNITKALAGFKKMGLELAIDDFGMGYSSFGYLKRLKIDRLKIDKFLIASIGKDQNWEAIIIAIIALGHSLGLRVIAEGVESKGQLDFLRHHGCDEIQGFFISKPMNKEKTLIFIKNYKNSIW